MKGNDPMEPQKTPVAWTTAVLVCRDCFARTDGPTCGGDGGAVKARIKGALRDLKPRVRTMETSCMDCCPEKAYMVAIVSPNASPQGFALTTLEQADEIVQIVRER